MKIIKKIFDEDDFLLEIFLGGWNVKGLDIKDESRTYLFDPSINKFGELEADEMFGLNSRIFGGRGSDTKS